MRRRRYPPDRDPLPSYDPPPRQSSAWHGAGTAMILVIGLPIALVMAVLLCCGGLALCGGAANTWDRQHPREPWEQHPPRNVP